MIIDNSVIEQALLAIISKGERTGVNKTDLLRIFIEEKLRDYVNSCLLELLEQGEIEFSFTNIKGAPVFRKKISRTIYPED